MPSTASATAAFADDTAWEETLRRMLPAGVPVPDEDHLDYSIAVVYDGPPMPPSSLPRIDPIRIPVVTPIDPFLLNEHHHQHHAPGDRNGVLPYSNNGSSTSNNRFSSSGTNNHSTLRSQHSSEEELEEPGESLFSVDVAALDLKHVARGDSARVGVIESDRDCSAHDDIENRTNVKDDGNATVELPKRNPMVTFTVPHGSEYEDADDDCDSEGFDRGDVVGDGEDSSSNSSKTAATESPAPATTAPRSGSRNLLRGRGPCGRCGKGNHLKDQEVCLVCDSR